MTSQAGRNSRGRLKVLLALIFAGVVFASVPTAGFRYLDSLNQSLEEAFAKGSSLSADAHFQARLVALADQITQRVTNTVDPPEDSTRGPRPVTLVNIRSGADHVATSAGSQLRVGYWTDDESLDVAKFKAKLEATGLAEELSSICDEARAALNDLGEEFATGPKVYAYVQLMSYDRQSAPAFLLLVPPIALPNGFRPETRPWFKAAMSRPPGAAFSTGLYIDAPTEQRVLTVCARASLTDDGTVIVAADVPIVAYANDLFLHALNLIVASLAAIAFAIYYQKLRFPFLWHLTVFASGLALAYVLLGWSLTNHSSQAEQAQFRSTLNFIPLTTCVALAGLTLLRPRTRVRWIHVALLLAIELLAALASKKISGVSAAWSCFVLGSFGLLVMRAASALTGRPITILALSPHSVALGAGISWIIWGFSQFMLSNGSNSEFPATVIRRLFDALGPDDRMPIISQTFAIFLVAKTGALFFTIVFVSLLNSSVELRRKALPASRDFRLGRDLTVTEIMPPHERDDLIIGREFVSQLVDQQDRREIEYRLKERKVVYRYVCQVSPSLSANGHAVLNYLPEEKSGAVPVVSVTPVTMNLPMAHLAANIDDDFDAVLRRLGNGPDTAPIRSALARLRRSAKLPMRIAQSAVERTDYSAFRREVDAPGLDLSESPDVLRRRPVVRMPLEAWQVVVSAVLESIPIATPPSRLKPRVEVTLDSSGFEGRERPILAVRFECALEWPLAVRLASMPANDMVRTSLQSSDRFALLGVSVLRQCGGDIRGVRDGAVHVVVVFVPILESATDRGKTHVGRT